MLAVYIIAFTEKKRLPLLFMGNVTIYLAGVLFYYSVHSYYAISTDVLFEFPFTSLQNVQVQSVLF